MTLYLQQVSISNLPNRFANGKDDCHWMLQIVKIAEAVQKHKSLRRVLNSSLKALEYLFIIAVFSFFFYRLNENFD